MPSQEILNCLREHRGNTEETVRDLEVQLDRKLPLRAHPAVVLCAVPPPRSRLKSALRARAGSTWEVKSDKKEKKKPEGKSFSNQVWFHTCTAHWRCYCSFLLCGSFLAAKQALTPACVCSRSNQQDAVAMRGEFVVAERPLRAVRSF